MHEDISISLKDITKTYKLYNSHAERVKETFHPFRKKYHRPFNALNGISLDAKTGETIGIIGRNGSGKSTLLQIISGILKPTAGIVEVAGRVSALLELGAGFNPEFTGRQNVYINAAILGLQHEEIEASFHDIDAFADIGEFIDQPVKTYSSGMYVRLAFATAVSVKPDILLVDEALAVGDTIFQAKCFAKFKEFQNKGITIVFVTHALDFITQYCSAAYLLEMGEVYASGPPKDVVDEYNRLAIKCSGSDFVQPLRAVKNKDVVKAKQWEILFRINPNENRYGNGKAEIVEGGIFSSYGEAQQNLNQGQVYEFKLKVRFNETITDPIFAYTIKDVKGFDISGTNTLYHNIGIGIVNKGDVVLASFTQKILLNQGSYLLSFGCAGHENGEYVVYERRYDYLTFDVISNRASVGIFDLDSDIIIRRI